MRPRAWYGLSRIPGHRISGRQPHVLGIDRANEHGPLPSRPARPCRVRGRHPGHSTSGNLDRPASQPPDHTGAAGRSPFTTAIAGSEMMPAGLLCRGSSLSATRCAPPIRVLGVASRRHSCRLNGSSLSLTSPEGISATSRWPSMTGAPSTSSRGSPITCTRMPTCSDGGPAPTWTSRAAPVRPHCGGRRGVSGAEFDDHAVLHDADVADQLERDRAAGARDLRRRLAPGGT